MKIIFSEYQSDYKSYHFPYQVYLLKEENDSIDEIYNMGFLPSRSRLHLYYLSRSTRIDLERFNPSSENRRILRKTDYLTYEVIKLDSFKYTYHIGKFGKDFYDQRFGKGTMSALRVKWLFTGGACSHVFTYYDKSDKDKIIGYCPVVITDNILHYTYPFYDIAYFERNLGMGMMLSALLWAQKRKKTHIYLGTCYTESSLYKAQFNGFEYFNGYDWSSDIDQLKSFLREGIRDHTMKHSSQKESIFEKKGIKISIKK